MSTYVQPVGYTPSNVRPRKPLMFGPVFRLIPATILLVVATAWGAPRVLPYTGLEVQKVPSEKCDKPAELEGPLAANNRLFSSSVVKVFAGVQGSGVYPHQNQAIHTVGKWRHSIIRRTPSAGPLS